MKIIIGAMRLAADRTSEGICSSKYVAALVAAGHDVTCITGDEMTDHLQNAWHARCAPLIRVDDGRINGGSTTAARLTSRLATSGSPGAYAARKLNGVSARATGYSLQTWDEVARWRRVLQSSVERLKPAAIIVRGAGREFEPHIAMLGWQSSVPWVAHYHDPYPGSLYPEPYRQHVALQSPRQEQKHRRIIRAADALTFPSQRLLEWVLCGDLERERHKAFVVPHIAGQPVATSPVTASNDAAVDLSLDSRHLNIVHTGTMLRERDPRPMLRGLLAFLEHGRERRDLVRLVFVGRVDYSHTMSKEWDALNRMGVVRCIDHRVSYQSALALSRSADCLLILEADAPESPFFPAKLADYLWLGKPILAASTDVSATADILGREYTLRVPPADSALATTAFERLWSAWRDGDLRRLVPHASIAAAMSETAVGRRTDEMFEFLFKTRRGRAA